MTDVGEHWVDWESGAFVYDGTTYEAFCDDGELHTLSASVDEDGSVWFTDENGNDQTPDRLRLKR